MANRALPYGNFNFIIEINGREAGGFSDASGLTTEVKMAEYRNGNDLENHVHKVPGIHTVGDVTLKRGVIDSTELWAWIEETRLKGWEAKREVVITLRNEQAQPVQLWRLRQAAPSKYTGPTFAAKGGTDVAMEELVLSCEGMSIEKAS